MPTTYVKRSRKGEQLEKYTVAIRFDRAADDSLLISWYGPSGQRHILCLPDVLAIEAEIAEIALAVQGDRHDLARQRKTSKS